MKRQLLTLSAAFVAFFGFSQSNPTPFDLSTGAYTFTEWDASSPAETYPANMIFHDYTAEPALESEPTGDWLCLYNIGSRARINGLGANGVAFINTGDRQDSDARCGNGSSRGYFVGDATVALNTTGRTNISVDFKATLTILAGGTREYGMRLQYRIGETDAWSDLPSVVEFTTGGKAANDFEELSAVLPSAADNQPIVQVRWKVYQLSTGGSGSRPQIALDEITIDSDEIIATPEASASVTTLNAFTQTLGTPSAEQSFTVEGTALTSDLTLTAPAEYEISLTSGSGFLSALSITPASGEVSTTTIYVRLNAANTGAHTGDITIESTGITTIEVAVSGQTNAVPTPAISASTSGLTVFNQILGTPSAEQSFTIEGTDLEEEITLTASAGYEVSLTSGSGFTSSVTVTETSGTVPATTIYVRLNETTPGTHSGTVTASSLNATDITINLNGETVAPASPEITTSTTTISGFNQSLGTPSAEQSFTVEGTDLEEDIILTASTGYEVSLTSGSGFASSVTIIETSGTVAATTIYVRLNETTAGNHSGTVTASSQNATDVTINLDGETTEETPSELLYYWHFNNMVSGADVTEIIADYSYLTDFDGKFTYTDPITGERDIDRYSAGSSFNLKQGETEGYSARVRNPSTTRSLVFEVPTTGAEGIGFKYAVQRSGQGMLNNIVQYSIDGTNFISTDLVNDTLEVVGDEVWQLFTFDFTSIAAVNNNPDFKIKITWLGNTVASNGNNRYDNITLTAESVSGLSVNPIKGLTKLSVYPTPFRETVSISASGNIEKIQIVDMSGKTVQTITGNNNEIQHISTADLISGTYFFVVQTTEGTFQLKSVKK